MASLLHFSFTFFLVACAGLQITQGQSCALPDVHPYCGNNQCSPENRLQMNSGDTCRTGFRTEADHVFPEDWAIMFDSYDYTRIIGDGEMFLSREFDNDGVGNRWTPSTSSCAIALTACEWTTGPQDNWLFSEHIKYPPGSSALGGGHPTEVFVNVSYNFIQCTGNQTCPNDFVILYRYDTNVIASEADRTNRNNYTPLFGQGTDTTTSRLQHGIGFLAGVRELYSFIAPHDSTGFHLALRDQGTCGQITRMIMYYTVCKEQQDGLVYYPELVRPPEGSPPNEAEACCAANSHPITSLTFRAYNVSDRRCERNVVCECDAGYMLDGTGLGCEACAAGAYRSDDSQQMCLSCPSNTVTDAVAASICGCIENYFRDETEGPGNDCTTSPGAPGAPVCSAMSGTTVTVQWTPPTDTGGRSLSDVCYIVEYRHISSTEEFIKSECVYDTMYTIPGLEPISQYRINVISENSVSDQDMRPGIRESTRTVSTVCVTGEGVPEAPIRVQVEVNRVFLWQPPAKPNGVITGYQVGIVYNTSSGTETRLPVDLGNTTFVYVFNRNVPANATATVTVRAMTSAGIGDPSSPITFEPFAPLTEVQRVCTLMDMGLYIGLTALIAVVATAGIFLIGCCLYCVCRKCCCKKYQADLKDVSENGYSNSVGLTEKVNWN